MVVTGLDDVPSKIGIAREVFSEEMVFSLEARMIRRRQLFEEVGKGHSRKLVQMF